MSGKARAKNVNIREICNKRTLKNAMCPGKKRSPFTASGNRNLGKYTLISLETHLKQCADLSSVPMCLSPSVSAGGLLCEFTVIRNDSHVVRSIPD